VFVRDDNVTSAAATRLRSALRNAVPSEPTGFLSRAQHSSGLTRWPGTLPVPATLVTVSRRKFDGLTCVLCGTHPSSSTGEHTEPRWFMKAFPASDGPWVTYKGSRRVRKEDGTVRPPQSSALRITLPVCKVHCNAELDRRFEKGAKPVVRRLLGGDLALCAADSYTFALWVLKTWLLTAHPAAVASDPGWPTSDWDLSTIPEDIFGWTVDGRPPPAGLSVWMTRRTKSLRIEKRPGIRVPLPTVVADGTTVRFHSFARGIRFLEAGFLDVDLVYHPGWDVEHPLASEGRAVQLWPRDSADELDLGAVPLEDRDHVSWYGAPTVHFEDAAYAALPRAPLSAKTPLTFVPPPPGVVSAFA
jgi:hypothetical protein